MPRSALLRPLLASLGLAAFSAVAGIHYASTQGAESIPALGALWAFVPTPAAFLLLLLGPPLPRAVRVAGRGYLALSAFAAIAVLGAVGWIGAERGMHPDECSSAEEESLARYPALATAAEKVHFLSADGTELVGWFVPGASRDTIVLFHGYGSCYQEMLSRADFLHAERYAVLFFDFRYRGESEGKAVTVGYRERDDAQGALAYLATRDDVDAERVGVLGVSMGAAVSIMVAADTPEIAALVAESSFKSADSAIGQSFEHFVDLPAFPFGPISVWIIERRLGIDAGDVAPEREIARISPRPILLIHGQADTIISLRDGEALYAAAEEPKEIWTVPGAGHVGGMEAAPEEYRRRVEAFFAEHLRR